MNPSEISRRQFLHSAVTGAAALVLLKSEQSVEARDNRPYGPFHMGIQSYSLRGYKLDEALDKTHLLGLKYWEGWDGHMPVTEDSAKIKEYRSKLADRGITMLTYGVVSFSSDEKDARRKFDFGKAMGVTTLSGYPSPDAFPVLDKLTEEYKINVGIHNHGPGDNLYDKLEKGLKAVEGHSVRIGSCDDTGHYLRSDEDPVEAARRFGKRVYGVHLKDVTADHQYTEMGKGKMDTVGLLKVLKANRFRGVLSLEYEEHEQDPIPYIEECLATVREAVKKI